MDVGSRVRLAPLRRPLAGLTISFMLGLLTGDFWSLSVPWLLAGAALAWLISFFMARPGWAAGALHLAVLLVGTAWLSLEKQPLSAAEVARQMGRDRARLELVGVVTDDPVAVLSDRGEAGWRFPVRAESLNQAGAWRRARGRVEVRWYPEREGATVRYGERWWMEGAGVRHAAEFGRPAGIWLPLRGESARCLAREQGSWLRARCLEARAACARLLALGIAYDPDAAGVLRAFMLGYREALPERAHRAFSRTGTLHIAAISGAHVVILAGLLLIPLKALGFSQTRWILVMGPILVLYALGTGLAASAVRACIMACVFWSAYAFRRRPDGPSALAFSALLILAVDPGQLWEAGFLLSFGVVAGLMLLVPALSDPLLQRLGGDEVLPPGPVRRALIPVMRGAVALAAVTLAAWLASLPMTAQYFNLFSPVGLVANLLVVPLASLILLTGCLTLAVGWLFPLGAEVFNHASRLLVQLLLWLVNGFHGWPGGHVFVVAPAWWFSLGWYAWLVAMARGGRRLRWMGALLAVLALGVGGYWYGTHQRAELAMTPMGRGMAVLIDGPRHANVLVDPGPAYRSRDVIRWLRTRGVNRLSAIMLTQSLVEQAGSLPALLEQMPVGELWLPASPVRSPVFASLVEQARAAGLTVRELGRGDSGALPGGLMWQVYHPVRGEAYANAAMGGLLVRISQGPVSALITGTPRPAREQALLGQPVDLAAAGLLATRWDEGSRWSGAWLAEVRPQAMARPRMDFEEEDPAGPGLTPVMEESTTRWLFSAARGGFVVKPPERWR
mgnify:FL=1